MGLRINGTTVYENGAFKTVEAPKVEKEVKAEAKKAEAKTEKKEEAKVEKEAKIDTPKMEVKEPQNSTVIDGSQIKKPRKKAKKA